MSEKILSSQVTGVLKEDDDEEKNTVKHKMSAYRVIHILCNENKCSVMLNICVDILK